MNEENSDSLLWQVVLFFFACLCFYSIVSIVRSFFILTSQKLALTADALTEEDWMQCIQELKKTNFEISRGPTIEKVYESATLYARAWALRFQSEDLSVTVQSLIRRHFEADSNLILHTLSREAVVCLCGQPIFRMPYVLTVGPVGSTVSINVPGFLTAYEEVAGVGGEHSVEVDSLVAAFKAQPAPRPSRHAKQTLGATK